ncbi:MAG TPA: hypothetical protein VMR77_03000 [Patescibacteria group bacterium]|jgi:hypothetical protein|nr:hypothetical protein [Patescibacteria group bacterium]
MNKLKLLFSSYILLLVGFFTYSFTQVDLSLTLSRLSVYQTIEKSLQHIGFYQRPLSTLIFIIIVSLLFIFYCAFLYLAKKGQLKIKTLAILTILTAVILVLSYNAFSYDLFNYIFDAKIVSHYHQLPYFYSALDFPKDPMLNFMRWTHRLYPYGPSWLILTVPLTFIGMDYFLPTFFLFKILMGMSFLGSCYLTYKISAKIFPENKLLNVAFFAFNPLVLIESLVSAHNDIPMIFFILLSIYLFLQKKKVLSWLSNLFSIGIKFSTGALLPLFILAEFFDKTGRKINWEKFFITAVLLSLTTVLVASIRTTFQPWYLIFPLSMAAFVARKKYIAIPAFVASIFAVSIYIPYILMTDYAKGYPQIIQNIELTGLITVSIVTVITLAMVKFFQKIN